MSKDPRRARAWRIILGHSLVAALCPLIPVPFLDDLILTRLHRRMSRALFALYGIKLSRKGRRILSDTPSHFFKGLLGRLVGKLIWAPLKYIAQKAVSKVLFFKACSDIASLFLHDGWLMTYALDQTLIDAQALERNEVRELEALRAAILATEGELRTSPLTLALSSLLKLRMADLMAAGQRLGRNISSADELDEALADGQTVSEREGLEWFFDAMFGVIGREEDYLEKIGLTMRRHLHAP